MCTQYFGKLDGESFAKIVKKDFSKEFREGIDRKKKLFLQDDDPIQNGKKANREFDAIGCKLIAIPTRSSDMTPIENIFNRIREKLTEDAITHQIKRENFEKFSVRVKRRFAEFLVEKMDKTIDIMQKRMKLIARSRGKKIQY